jgi:hypothetical protein
MPIAYLEHNNQCCGILPPSYPFNFERTLHYLLGCEASISVVVFEIDFENANIFVHRNPNLGYIR